MVCFCTRHGMFYFQDEKWRDRLPCARLTPTSTTPRGYPRVNLTKVIKQYKISIPVWSPQRNNVIVFQKLGWESSVVSHQHSHFLWLLWTLLQTSKYFNDKSLSFFVTKGLPWIGCYLNLHHFRNFHCPNLLVSVADYQIRRQMILGEPRTGVSSSATAGRCWWSPRPPRSWSWSGLYSRTTCWAWPPGARSGGRCSRWSTWSSASTRSGPRGGSLRCCCRPYLAPQMHWASICPYQKYICEK